MNLLLERFDSIGIKSIDTVSTILAKNFMKTNSQIITKYILSADILFNINNIFKNFKYGIDSIIDSMKIKKNQSALIYPKRLFYGILSFFSFLLYGVNSSLLKFLSTLRNLTKFVYGKTVSIKEITECEQEWKRHWMGYDLLADKSRSYYPAYFKNKMLHFVFTRVYLYGNITIIILLLYYVILNYTILYY